MLLIVGLAKRIRAANLNIRIPETHCSIESIDYIDFIDFIDSIGSIESIDSIIYRFYRIYRKIGRASCRERV